MAVDIDLVYQGELRCAATHRPSGSAIATDAPLDNGGRGTTFSPTDLVAAALGACVMTIMGLVAGRHGWNLAGSQIHVAKEMVDKPLRRIGALRTTVAVRSAVPLAPADRQRLENAARHCPVHQSLHPDIAAPIDFAYE